jgi:AraC-like DNA-binding protein
MFIRSYRLFRLRMDNYFSDPEAGRLSWVVFSFFAALAVGVMALLSAVFISVPVALLFSIVFNVFYIWFAIRFMNYAHQFHVIERAMDDHEPEIAIPEKTETALFEKTIVETDELKTSGKNSYTLLGEKIEQWVADKGFMEQGITIDELAAKLLTNNKYLSTYINTYKKQTFREWINEMRIEEAKILLLQHPKLTVTEIARRIGFSDKSHFLRQFKMQVKVSPTEYKSSFFPV